MLIMHFLILIWPCFAHGHQSLLSGRFLPSSTWIHLWIILWNVCYFLLIVQFLFNLLQRFISIWYFRSTSFSLLSSKSGSGCILNGIDWWFGRAILSLVLVVVVQMVCWAGFGVTSFEKLYPLFKLMNVESFMAVEILKLKCFGDGLLILINLIESTHTVFWSLQPLFLFTH